MRRNFCYVGILLLIFGAIGVLLMCAQFHPISKAGSPTYALAGLEGERVDEFIIITTPEGKCGLAREVGQNVGSLLIPPIYDKISPTPISSLFVAVNWEGATFYWIDGEIRFQFFIPMR